MAMENSEREQFEKWFAKKYLIVTLGWMEGEPARCFTASEAQPDTTFAPQELWESWQASAKLSRAAGEAAGLEKAARSLEDKIATLSRLPGSDYEYGVSKGCEIALQILRALSTPPKDGKP